MGDRAPGLGIIVRQISAAETLELRLEVLRPGRLEHEVVFAGDELPTTTHWGAFDDQGRLAAIASLYRASRPGTSTPAWQLRGMASRPDLRGDGFGAAVLKACIDWVRCEDPDGCLWCNARTEALGFYRRYGFETEGAEFIIEGVGPHWVMSRMAVPGS